MKGRVFLFHPNGFFPFLAALCFASTLTACSDSHITPEEYSHDSMHTVPYNDPLDAGAAPDHLPDYKEGEQPYSQGVRPYTPVEPGFDLDMATALWDSQVPVLESDQPTLGFHAMMDNSKYHADSSGKVEPHLENQEDPLRHFYYDAKDSIDQFGQDLEDTLYNRK